jgi:hypothetical protein
MVAVAADRPIPDGRFSSEVDALSHVGMPGDVTICGPFFLL